MTLNKKELTITLSKLKQKKSHTIELEQYQLDSEDASKMLWWAYLNGEIKNKIVADLGCGNGILGIGALILGAKKVYFVDIDEEALEAAKENSKEFKNTKFVLSNVKDFKEDVDVVLENPPFGVQKRKADLAFLEKAMEISKTVYTLHKIESKEFIEKVCIKNKFKVESLLEFKMLLKKVFMFHKKEKYFVDVGCWLLRKL